MVRYTFHAARGARPARRMQRAPMQRQPRTTPSRRGPAVSDAATALRMMRPMDDQPEPPLTPGPFAHLVRREPRSERQQRIDAFNEHQRRRGSRKRWHDYFPDEAANDRER